MCSGGGCEHSNKAVIVVCLSLASASPRNTVNLFAHMMDDSMLQLEMYRMENEKTISETLMTVRLNSSHVLHTRLNWRPRMLTDLQVSVLTVCAGCLFSFFLVTLLK